MTGLADFELRSTPGLFHRLDEAGEKLAFKATTPEEVDQLRPLAQCASLPGDNHSWAIYNRNRDYDGFDYSTREPGAGIKTVKLRGAAK